MRLRLTGVRLLDPAADRDEVGEVCLIDGRVAADDGGHFEVRELPGAWVVPALVDLVATGIDPVRDAKEAVDGGFGFVLGTPGSRCLPEVGSVAGALTQDCAGRELADMGTSVDAGVWALSNGRMPIDEPAVLLNALRYAANLGRPVFLRPATRGLEAGPVRLGPLSMTLGLRGTPAESEVLGIWTAAHLARRAGAAVHLTHVWSREGVEAVSQAKAQGFPVTASTTVGQLCLPIEALPEVGYAGQWNLGAVVGDEEDRSALASGLGEGVLCGVATDHQWRPAVDRNAPFGDALGGGAHLRHAWPLLTDLLGPKGAVAALSTGPAHLLGRPVGLVEGATVALVRPEAAFVDGQSAVGISAPHPWDTRGFHGNIRLLRPHEDPKGPDA